MSKLKLMTIIGTRPEIIKLCETIKLADKMFEHTLVHTGQNYDYTLNQIFFENFGLREPDFYLDSIGANLGETIGNIISKSYNLINEIKPDAILILGDTNSALAAISAKRLKTPIFHMEAGNRCFDENLPEEINRKIVDHISDINLPYTENARRNLLAEGLSRETTFVIGSPMREIISLYRNEIDSSEVLKKLGLKPKQYMVLSAHREENIDNEMVFMSLMNAINSVAEKYKMPIIYSLHPRSKNIISKRNFIFNPLISKMQPFGFFDYVNLQLNSFCVLSDSGTLAEESALLHFPAVSLRTSTERQEVFDKGVMTLGGITENDIEQAIEFAVNIKNNCTTNSNVTDYQEADISKKVVNIIQSFTKVVNINTWKK
ncbi:MAG: UDP-N-acetylglucosamine 2-epimerase (non-hydrolyzing) [Clostridia bacterium]